MKIAVRYQSRGGNTKTVAEAIAKKAGVAAEPVTVSISEPVDLLFVGGGVYAWGLDKDFAAYLERLTPNTVKTIAAFTTAGVMDKTKDIQTIVKKNGISVSTETLAVKLGVKNHHAWIGRKGAIELTDKQVSAINGFVENCLH
ncbi:MAG: flavodoxin family protein [Ruminiclostridium sp.]